MKRLPRALLALSLSVSSMAAAPAVLLALPSVAQAQPQGQAKGHALPRRGDYLPPDLVKAGPNVDAAAQRLRRPPSGYGWFSLASVFVLASLSSGLIVEVAAP
jgi:Ni/Co efflux regulator RcnB